MCYHSFMPLPHRLQRILSALDIEERVLNVASFLALISVLLPWISGEWLGGDPVSYNGFSFYTAFLGIIIFLIHGFIIAMTAVPLLGGPVIIRKNRKETLRLYLASQTFVLALASLSVLTKVTYEFSRIEIRFGMYLTLVCSIVCTLYAFLKWQEHRSTENQDLFRHPEEPIVRSDARTESVLPPPPPPPPPPPLPPEEHYVHM